MTAATPPLSDDNARHRDAGEVYEAARAAAVCARQHAIDASWADHLRRKAAAEEDYDRAIARAGDAYAAALAPEVTP